MTRTFLIASLALGLFKLCLCIVLIEKPCPQPPVTENFDKQAFSGIWYHIEKYTDDYQVEVLKYMTCSTVTYAVQDEETVAINNTFKTPIWVEGDSDISQGSTTKFGVQAKIRDQKEPAKWIVFLQQGKDASEYGTLVDLDLNYWILETDYNNYALVWTCQSYDNRSLIDASILSRKPTLDENLLSDLHEKLGNYELDKKYFRSVNQTDCQH